MPELSLVCVGATKLAAGRIISTPGRLEDHGILVPRDDDISVDECLISITHSTVSKWKQPVRLACDLVILHINLAGISHNSSIASGIAAEIEACGIQKVFDPAGGPIPGCWLRDLADIAFDMMDERDGCTGCHFITLWSWDEVVDLDDEFEAEYELVGVVSAGHLQVIRNMINE